MLRCDWLAFNSFEWRILILSVSASCFLQWTLADKQICRDFKEYQLLFPMWHVFLQSKNVLELGGITTQFSFGNDINWSLRTYNANKMTGQLQDNASNASVAYSFFYTRDRWEWIVEWSAWGQTKRLVLIDWFSIGYCTILDFVPSKLVNANCGVSSPSHVFSMGSQPQLVDT